MGRVRIHPSANQRKKKTLVQLEEAKPNIKMENAFVQQHLDTLSHWMPSLNLGIYRLVFALVTGAFVGYYTYFAQLLVLPYLLFWNYSGLFVYFTLAAYTTFVYCQNHHSSFKVPSSVLNALAIGCVNISLIQSVFYWIYEFPHKNQMLVENEYVLYVANGLNLVLIVLDLILSRMPFEKVSVWYSCFFVLGYVHLVWLLKYQFQFDWPSQIFSDTYNLNGEPVYMFSFLAILLSAVVIGSGIAFFVIQLRSR